MPALFAGLRPLLAPVAALLLLAACGEDEVSETAPAETSDLGRETDEALEAAGEALGEIGEAAGTAAERAAEDMGRVGAAVGRAGEAVGDAVDRSLEEPETGADADFERSAPPAVTPERE